MLAGIFERCMKRRGVKDTDSFDWEKLATPENNPSANNFTTSNPSPVASKPTG